MVELHVLVLGAVQVTVTVVTLSVVELAGRRLVELMVLRQDITKIAPET